MVDANYIEKRKKELTDIFDKVKAEILTVEQRHTVLMDEVKRLQGAYAELIKTEKGEVNNEEDSKENNAREEVVCEAEIA